MKIEHYAILLLALLVVLLLVFPKAPANVSESDAKNWVLEDMRTKYPQASSLEIISVDQNSTTSAGAKSYSIKGAAVLDSNSLCPERYHLYYDYPKSNFVTWTETIVKNCAVCTGQAQCIIAFPEQAVIASHTFNGTARVSQFITTYPAAMPNATFYESFNGVQNVWLVKYTAPESSYSLLVLVSKVDGKIISVDSENT